jgi:hypothetical protein
VLLPRFDFIGVILGSPSFTKVINNLELENKKLRQLLRQATKMIKTLETELNKPKEEAP